MRRFMMLTAFVAGMTWLAVPGEAWAQNRERAWEIFPFLGHLSLSTPGFGDVLEVRPDTPSPGQTEIIIVNSEIDDDLSLGLRFGFNWTKHQMIEFALAGSSTDAKLFHTTTVQDAATGAVQSVTTIEEDLSVDILIGEVNYVYNFFLHRRDKIVAYLSGGAGIVNTSVFGLTAEPLLRPILDEHVGESSDFTYNFGGGIRFFGSEKVGFRVDLRQFEYSPSNRVDQDILQISMGVTLILGGP